jgi:hypothetical protein
MPGTHLYSDPEIYDILHAPGTADEVRTLADVHRRFASGSPKVALEPACGSGRYFPGLLRRGFEVHGFDADPGMVRYAKKAEAKAIIRTGRFDTFSTTGLRRRNAGRVGLAFCPINSIRHVASDAEMVRHLKRVKSCLHPQGVYVVGISLSAYGLEMPTEDIWTGSRRGVHPRPRRPHRPRTGRAGAQRARDPHRPQDRDAVVVVLTAELLARAVGSGDPAVRAAGDRTHAGTRPRVRPGGDRVCAVGAGAQDAGLSRVELSRARR